METVDLVIWEGSASVVNVPFPKRKRGMVTLCSTSSMTQSTTGTDMGDPMVVPIKCLLEKLSSVRQVCCVRSPAILTARSTGTYEKRDVTLKFFTMIIK